MTNNLPVKANEKGLTIEKKRNFARANEELKRAGKIALQGIIAFGGLTVSAISAAPVLTTLGLCTGVLGASRAIYNTRFKTYKDMIFTTKKKLNGEISIFQDATNVKMLSKMKGFEPHEKAALMGLQNFIGLQRYQQKFMDKNMISTLSRDGKSWVYDKTFSTVTHGINIKTFKALESLGYIQIESLEDKKKKTLVLERLGFGQYKEAGASIKAVLTNNQEEKNKYMKQMQEIKFKLTDKPFDINDVYKEYLDIKDTKEKNPRRKDIKRIGVILDALKDKNIDIEKDKLGIPKINYNSDKSFVKRIEQEKEFEKRENSFRENLSNFEEQKEEQNEIYMNQDIQQNIEDKEQEI